MILVEDVYQELVQRSGLDRIGYNSTAEFNRSLKTAENILFDFYLRRFESEAIVDQALRPFEESKVYAGASGVYTKPSDQRHILTVSGRYEARYWPAVRIQAGQTDAYLTSTLRAPNIKKYRLYWEETATKINLWPTDVTIAKVVYLRYPVYGSRGVIIDSVNDVENYDASASVNLEWNPAQKTSLVDILLVLKGIEVKDQELAAYTRNKIETFN